LLEDEDEVEELDVALLEDEDDIEELDVALLEEEEGDEELDVALLEDEEDIEEIDVELIEEEEETEQQVEADMQVLLEAVEEELGGPVEESAKPASKSAKKVAKRARPSGEMQWTPDNLEALGDLVNRLKETTRVSEQFEQDNAALREQFDVFKAEAGKNERLFRDELEGLQDEIATLRQELDGDKVEAKEWHKRAESAEAAMGQSQSAKRELHEEISSLKESLGARNETVAQVAEVLSKLAKSLQD